MPIFAKNIKIAGEKSPAINNEQKAEEKISEAVDKKLLGAKIFGKNIRIGPPTSKKVTAVQAPKEKFSDVVKKIFEIKNKENVFEKAAEKPAINVETKPEAMNEIAPRYVEHRDGDLIRHINKKSTYLRDMLEISS